MKRRVAISCALAGLAACLTVPPEETPPESARKATVTVDHTGQVIEGGNITINIPAGAVPQGERIQVTVDVIMGVPAGHLSEAYLIGPEGYLFEKPVTLTYLYQERHVAEVANLYDLFLGTAQGHGWAPLAEPSHDVDARRVAGVTSHFSVFGLIDPAAASDGGVVVDSGGVDAGAADASGTDLRRQDAAGTDTSYTDAATGFDAATNPEQIHVQLTWTGANADLDLHLLRLEDGQFTDDDCYYANCKNTGGLEWPPSGLDGNPFMDIDDLNGFGPENINISQPANGTYIAAMHAYNLNGDALPMDFTIKVFHGGTMIFDETRQLAACDDLHKVVNIVVTNGGLSVSASARTDPATPAGHAICT